MLKNFGKLITVLVIAFSLFVLVGCTKEETISFADENLTMVVGDEETLAPVLSDEALEVVYSAVPADAVTFDGSKITAVKAGTVTVTATIKDTKISATLTVTITEPVVKTYAADGVYTAFEAGDNHGAPMVTTVSVTIADDEIVSFYIDCVQSTAVKTEEVVTDYKFNEKSKKELGYLYGMHNTPNAEFEYERQDLTTTEGLAAYEAYLEESGKLEWFEQAALIEAHFVANGTTLELDETTEAITNVAGVTVKDGSYSKLAAEAVQNAIDGKVISVMASGNHDIIWAEGTVNAEGSLTELELNTLQGRMVEGAYAWDAKNKQEKGYLYGMHNSPNAELEYEKQDLTTTEGLAAYKAYLEEAGKLEWFEQVELITDYVLENGVAGLVLEGTKLDGSVEALSGVSITAIGYVTVLNALYTAFPNA